MAKVQYNCGIHSMKAEGSEGFVQKQVEAFMSLQHPPIEMKLSFDPVDGDKDSIEKIAADSILPNLPKAVMESNPPVDWDVVAIYDDAGIPSIMHRFRCVSNKELFGGSDKPHPAFVIGGEVYDEIYISVYPNTMIHGKPYSLPYTDPATGFTADEFAEACFSKGEGWHPLTAAEWGLLANLSHKNGTLPHGNTFGGKYHANPDESGQNVKDSGKTLTGSGPATWTHDHTKTGVHDLCGNVHETIRGLRVKNGVLMVAKNNDAALPETDLTQCGDDWQLMKDDKGAPIYVDADDGVTFTTDPDRAGGYGGCEWGKVKTECQSEMLKEYAMFAGEPGTFCFVDATEGEYLPIRGGGWNDGGDAGLFYLALSNPRSYTWTSSGGRSAFFRKKQKAER